MVKHTGWEALHFHGDGGGGLCSLFSKPAHCPKDFYSHSRALHGNAASNQCLLPLPAPLPALISDEPRVSRTGLSIAGNSCGEPSEPSGALGCCPGELLQAGMDRRIQIQTVTEPELPAPSSGCKSSSSCSAGALSIPWDRNLLQQIASPPA